MTRMSAGARLMRVSVFAAITFSTTVVASAQQPQTPAPVDHSQHQEATPPLGKPTSGVSSPLGLPMTREGSGTAWLPDASPMYAVHGLRGPWELMLHGNAFIQFLNDRGPRGANQFGSINWLMAMARRPAGQGRFGVNAMLSVEPWTIRGCGYPDLLATGERCEDHAIVDQQHPHDLFMELAAYYERPISDGLAFQVYGGPSGEPALGPVAYPHRISALPNPLAPISHHWLDATHITFGVVTAGVYGRRWKAEGSVFNGREPDEDRLGFDFAALDSFAGRLWFLPSERLALQVSAGHLREAEPGDDIAGRVDVDRLSASATYHRMFDNLGVWASTIAWGRNRESGESSTFVLGETNLTLNDRDSWFGRVDIGTKTAHDLDIRDLNETFTVAKAQAGYLRYFDTGTVLKPGIGASLSMSILPPGLQDAYGSRTPLGFGVFVTVRAAGMAMSGTDPHVRLKGIVPPSSEAPR